MAVCKEEVSIKQEWSSSLLQEEPESHSPHIKEEQEEQLQRPEEPDGSMLTLPAVKSEDGAEDISSHCCEVEVELESDTEVNEDSDDCEETSGGVRSQSPQTNFFYCPYPECLFSCKSYEFLHEHIRFRHTDLYLQMLRNGHDITSAASQQITNSVTSQKLGDTDEPSDDWEYWTQQEETSGGVISQSSQAQAFLHKHEERPHNCALCDKSFKRLCDLSKHMRSHTGKPYRCEHCDKSFHLPSGLKNHQVVHSHRCEHCGKSFHHPATLKVHQRIHTGETPYNCEHCDKTFVYSEDAKRHVRVHTREKQSALLKSHQRIHTGEKPFPCKNCDKSFNQSGDLNRHQRIHTGEKPFHCKHCDKSYSQSASLKRHQHIHNEKSFSHTKNELTGRINFLS